MFRKLELVWVGIHVCRTACLVSQDRIMKQEVSVSGQTNVQAIDISLFKCTCSCHSSTLLRIGIDWHGVTISRVKGYGKDVHLGLHVPQHRQEAKIQMEWEHSHRGVGAKPSSHLMIPAPCNPTPTPLSFTLADKDLQGLCVSCQWGC